MDRAIVTFHDPKNDQKIIVNLTHDTTTDNLEVTCKFDPTPNEQDEMGLVGYLSELFLTSLYGEDANNPIESNSR